MLLEQQDSVKSDIFSQDLQNQAQIWYQSLINIVSLKSLCLFRTAIECLSFLFSQFSAVHRSSSCLLHGDAFYHVFLNFWNTQVKGKSMGTLCFPMYLVRNGGGGWHYKQFTEAIFPQTLVVCGTGLTAGGRWGECFLCQMGFARHTFPLMTLCHEILDTVPYHWEVVGAIITICDFCFLRFFFFLC